MTGCSSRLVPSFSLQLKNDDTTLKRDVWMMVSGCCYYMSLDSWKQNQNTKQELGLTRVAREEVVCVAHNYEQIIILVSLSQQTFENAKVTLNSKWD